MLTRSSSRKAKKGYAKDRHLKKGDRHKDRHKDSGHICICGYSRCGEVRDGFKGTGSIYDRTPIRLKKPAPCNEWDDFFDSLVRNLHVPDEVVNRIREKGKGYRFDVCAHHFTEEVVAQYWNNTSISKRWAIRFSYNEARDIPHLALDRRDRDKDGNYFLNANHPMMDAINQMLLLNSERGERVSSRSSFDSSIVSSQQSSLSQSESQQKDDKIKKLKEMVKQLRRENRALKQTSKRRKEKVNNASADNKLLREQLDEAYAIQDVTDMLVKAGGISRVALFSDKFHKKYPGAAKCLWGFESYEETVTYAQCLFPDLDVTNIPKLHRIKNRKSRDDDNVKFYLPWRMTPLEKCLACRLLFRTDLNQEFIGLIFGKHRTTIGNTLDEWAPRWVSRIVLYCCNYCS